MSWDWRSDGTFDKKTLHLGTVSFNLAEIDRKTINSTSVFPGVNIHKSKWRAQIKFHSVKYELGYFDDEKSAANAYAWVQESRCQIEGKLGKISDTASSEVVKKSIRTANKAIIRSYVRADDYPKVKLNS
jgi:hypothetical protein